MIKKARLRFIAVTMGILLIIFGFVFGVSNYFITKSVNRTILASLSDAERIYRAHSIERFKEDVLVISISENDDGIMEYSIINGKDAYTEKFITSLVQNAVLHTYDLASVGDLYYILFDYNEETVLIGSNMSQFTAVIRTGALQTFVMLTAIYFVLFIVVILASYLVFKPIKDNLARQKQFISDASHELRTPVTIISANADVLKNYVDNDYLESIKTQTKRMETLVSDMLSLCRNDEDGKAVIKEEFCISDEVNETVLPFEALIFEQGKTLETDVDENLTLNGDKQGLKTILNILLDNATKYTPKNGKIKVKLIRESYKFVLTVYNTGSCIREENENKIFERFYRGENSRSRQSGGSGLGLSIAKAIADKNKWKISAKSCYEESMTITLII